MVVPCLTIIYIWRHVHCPKPVLTSPGRRASVFVQPRTMCGLCLTMHSLVVRETTLNYHELKYVACLGNLIQLLSFASIRPCHYAMHKGIKNTAYSMLQI